MLRKAVAGSVTTMTYNAANQLTSLASGEEGALSDAASPAATTSPGNAVAYHYDRAGRMLGPEGGARSAYGWLDKVVELTTTDGRRIGYEYWPDGQLAAKQEAGAGRSAGIQRIANRSTNNEQPTAELDTFLWDGLALLRRGDTIYINEPHPSGGAVIASFPVGQPERMTYYLNDMLGTTLATAEGGSIRYASLSAFGQQLDKPLPQPTTIALPTTGADFSQNNPTQQPNATTIP